MLAIWYLLCVLAPGVSLAFAETGGTPHCLTGEDHRFGTLHGQTNIHDAMLLVHDTDEVHVNSVEQIQLGKSNKDDEMKPIVETSAPTNDPHKTPGPQCCGMLCLSVLPATIIDIAAPSAPTSLRDPENCRDFADRAPPRLYRPPIS
ncbi:MAG: hypothetical protein WAV72_13620 [Bradyrhizobium sp.]